MAAPVEMFNPWMVRFRALAVIPEDRSTVNLNAIAEQAKVRAVAGSSPSVVLRARHTLTGSSTSYMLPSNEVTWQRP